MPLAFMMHSTIDKAEMKQAGQTVTEIHIHCATDITYN